MRESTIVVFLQNAWSDLYTWLECGIEPTNDHRWIWDRQGWLAAFQRSRSGRRWASAIDPVERWGSGVEAKICGYPVWFDNTTPMIASKSSGKYPPNLDYMKRLLDGELLFKGNPLLVVACGTQATAAAKEVWSGSMIAMPHPANRVLTNDAMLCAGAAIAETALSLQASPQGTLRRRVVQERGAVRVQLLEA